MKSFDVVIVGGGIIGTSVALELAAEKLRVAVLDRQQPGEEASCAAAGMLSPAPDSPRGIPLAPLANESLNLYPEFVETVERASGQSVDYARKGAVEVFFGIEAETQRDKRVTECTRLGVKAQAVKFEEIRKKEPLVSSLARAAVCFPEEARVDPRLLIRAVIGAAQARGVQFFPDCEVTALEFRQDRCAGVRTLTSNFVSENVIVAAGSFSASIGGENNQLARLAPTRPVRGQLIALRRDGLNLTCVLRSDHVYLVPRRDGRVIAGSTLEEAGFEKRVTASGIQQILDRAIELCFELAGAEIVEMWSGLRPGTPDDLPIIGPTDIDGLLIATGHYRNGILLAPVTAKLIKECITHRRTMFDAQAFSPLRFKETAAHAG